MAISCNICRGGQNLCFKKSWNIDENTKHDDGHKKLDNALGNIGIDILFSVLVRVAHGCEPEMNKWIKKMLLFFIRKVICICNNSN